jgi:soluble lytic murein transglycosylase
MYLVLLLSLFSSTVFTPTVERAFSLFKTGDWAAAASALDEAYSDDPELFAANNLHYLRGRIAESQNDWARARTEFEKVTAENPLYALAMWHAARSAVRLSDDPAADSFLSRLPRTFPAELKMQIAREASQAVAVKIYQTLTTREARLERAKVRGDRTALWALLRERKEDDSALQGALLLNGAATTAQQRLDLADTFMAHRQFDNAQALYRQLANGVFASRARYQLARIQFLREDYSGAIRSFEEVAKDYPGTDWEKDSEYQIASCYWRLGDYPNSEKAYVRYMAKYGRLGQYEGAVRNLVDVYRAMSENGKALALIDSTLRRQTTVATRQVLLFSKAKVLYIQGRYTAARTLFGDLARARLRSTPGGTTREEARYFEALSLAKAGSQAAAEVIWRELARDAHSYYGQKSLVQLGMNLPDAEVTVCTSPQNVAVNQVANLESHRRPLFTSVQPVVDPVSELAFLQLWDEAALWMETKQPRPAPQAAAELAYAGGRYHRSIFYADRLPRSERTSPLLYPAGFRRIICNEAQQHAVDPLWLHAIIWQESKYNPAARSGASARGLMQFIPETAAAVSSALGMQNLQLEKLYEPAVNIRLGAYYWKSLLSELRRPEMALAAYNGGIDNVRRWRAKWAETDEFFVADIGFVETKRYVMEVFKARAAYQALGRQ